MKTQALAFLLIGLVVGIGGTAFAMKRTETASTKSAATNAAAATDTRAGMDMGSTASSTGTASSMSMDQMTTNLQGKSGDNFDKAFISEMIAHHQGAIGMAKLAPSQAKHQEIKDLANGIIAAQTKEIAQMQQWQKDWGY